MNIKIVENLFIRHNEVNNLKQSIWFLHGFADSGLAYKEVLQSSLAEKFNLFIVDLPGFGVSPINNTYSSIKQQANLLSNIILQEVPNNSKINIVAHSLGGLIGTWICNQLDDRINYYFNIEGNLTEADSYFSSKPLKFSTPNEFAKSFKNEVFENAKKEEKFKRYYSSLIFADPIGMWNWGYSSQEYIKNNKCGHEFKNLKCNKIYIWGDVDTPMETQTFLTSEEIQNILFKGIGHWHMTENTIDLYSYIQKILDNR